MTTRYQDALDVLGLRDEVNEVSAQLLAQLDRIEAESRRERTTKSQAGDLVIKSKTREPFYQGPATWSNPRATVPWYTGPALADVAIEKSQAGGYGGCYSVRDVTRASVGLFTPLSREGHVLYEAESRHKAFADGCSIHELLHGRRPRQDWPVL